MRVLIGLAALAAVANAQTTVIVNKTPVYGNFPVAPPVGQTSLASIVVNENTTSGLTPPVTPVIGGGFVNSNNYAIYVPSTVSAIAFTFSTNTYTGQMQYRWSPNYPSPATNYPNNGLTAVSYTCDPCSDNAGNGTPISCNTSTGPGTGASPSTGFKCSSLTRLYTLSNLAGQSPQNPNVVNSFAVQLLDIQTNPAPNTSSYSFTVVRLAPPVILGDPQIVGMQGQDFQVHGVPDEIFNIVTYPTLQINARFTYLESGECHDNFTACFAHPGTYISEEGFRIGKDKVRVTAGTFKKGLTVHVNGKKIKQNTDLKHGAVEMVNHRRVVVHTEIMKVAVSNSDNFLNQELELMDDKLVTLGTKRTVLKDNERFHPEVPLHGLQGQTWRNVEYPSGLDYEGSIMDYHVVDGNLFGTDFVFNQFSS